MHINVSGFMMAAVQQEGHELVTVRLCLLGYGRFPFVLVKIVGCLPGCSVVLRALLAAKPKRDLCVVDALLVANWCCLMKRTYGRDYRETSRVLLVLSCVG